MRNGANRTLFIDLEIYERELSKALGGTQNLTLVSRSVSKSI